MADYTYYVNPAATTGGDGTADSLTGGTCAYQTLNAALTARAGGSSGDTFTFLCSGNGSSWIDTTPAVISTSWATGVTVIVEGYNGNYVGKQTGDTYDNTNCYALESTNQKAIECTFVGAVELRYLQVDSTKAGNYYATVSQTPDTAAAQIIVDSCRLRCSRSDSTKYGTVLSVMRGTVKNNTLESNGVANANSFGLYRATYNGTAVIVNNTIYDAYVGARIASYDNATWQNNVIAGATDDWSGPSANNSGTYSYNADGNDGDRPDGAANFVNLSSTLTDELTDPANGDLTVAGNGASNNIWDAGTSGGSIPTVDILGTSRSNYSIGAFEYVAAGGVAVTVPQADLTLSTTAPTVLATANISIEIPQGNLVLDSTAPTAGTSDMLEITVPQADLVLSATAPTVAVSANIDIQVPVADLVLSTTAPTAVTTEAGTIIIPQADLTLSSTAPTVALSQNVAIAVPAGDLTLSSTAPQVGISWSIVVPQADLALSTTAPSVLSGFNIFVPSSDLALSSAAPTVSVTTASNITIPQNNLTLSTTAPTIDQTGIEIWTEISAVSTVWTEI